MRPFLILVMLLLSAAAPAPSSEPAPAVAAVSPDAARSALEALRDPVRRAALETVLQTLATTQIPASAAAPPATPTPVAVPLKPGSVGADLVVGVSGQLRELGRSLMRTVLAITDFPLLGRWIAHLASDPDSQEEVADAAWHLLLILGLAVGAASVLSRLLRRPIALLANIAPAARAGTLDRAYEGAPRKRRARTTAVLLLRRLPLALARFGLSMVPVLLIAAIGYGLLETRLGNRDSTNQVVTAALEATLIWRTVVAAVASLLSPTLPRLRLVGLPDHAAAWVASWFGQIAAVAVFGRAAIEVAVVFGLYQVARDAMVRIVALAVVVLLGRMVVQARHAVARVVGPGAEADGIVALARARAAEIWHFAALFVLAALWFVWALDTPDGFARVLRGVVSTVVIVGIARFLAALLHSAMDPVSDAAAIGLHGVWRRYRPLLRGLLTGLLVMVAALILLQAWGLDALSNLLTDGLGGRIASTLLTCAITLAAAAFVWEATNAGVAGHLARLDAAQQMARAGRMRTLLPMLRTALLCAIVLFAGLSVLREIGVDVAPLLAGAGVVGIAIGFGSQKLVQDIITGLFLLLENTMQVGDVVTLGGLSGSVEALSIRTIRLRALDGAVHVVPFSAVTTVTNMTRDFAYAVIDLIVGLNEEPDRVAAMVVDVAGRMRAEPRWNGVLEGDLDVMGVERFVDTAYVLRLRIKTRPSQRWAVARELNQRFKALFDEAKIESPITAYRALGIKPPTVLVRAVEAPIL